MSIEEKQNFQTYQDSDSIKYPKNEKEVSSYIKKFYKKVLDVSSLLNPGKVYPILRKCAEEGRVHVHRGKTKFPDIPRF